MNHYTEEDAFVAETGDGTLIKVCKVIAPENFLLVDADGNLYRTNIASLELVPAEVDPAPTTGRAGPDQPSVAALLEAQEAGPVGEEELPG